MATVEMSAPDLEALPDHSAGRRELGPKPLHRVAAVRRRQGVSLRSVARQLGIDLREARRQESPHSDLRLSELKQWQQVLGVPLEELLTDDEAPLSRPVMERAKLLRIMKTAAAIQERAMSPGLRRMSQMLVDQLVDIMPELKHIGAWHSVGQRRSLNELGRAAERCLPDDFLYTLTRND